MQYKFGVKLHKCAHKGSVGASSEHNEILNPEICGCAVKTKNKWFKFPTDSHLQDLVLQNI